MLYNGFTEESVLFFVVFATDLEHQEENTMSNRKKSALIARVLALCLAAAVLSGCSKSPATNQVTTDPTQPVQTAPAASGSLAQVETEGSLQSWELNASVWSSSNGATVTLNAQPRTYEKGQSASFVVRLEGKEVENVSCTWNGSYYTASVDLEAADGYEYECVLFPPQGVGEHYTLSDAYDSLVYMKRSLDAYCNLYISDFKDDNGKFTVTAGWASVQLPQLTTAGTEIGFQKAQLVFSLNGETVETQDVTLPQGEGKGSYESSLSNISFTMPKMDDDYQLDLTLVVTLTNGEELTANGGSWFYNNGELKMAAG